MAKKVVKPAVEKDLTVDVNAEEIAAVAFAEHAHAKKVWVNAAGEFYLHKVKKCVVVERPEEA